MVQTSAMRMEKQKVMARCKDLEQVNAVSKLRQWNGNEGRQGMVPSYFA